MMEFEAISTSSGVKQQAERTFTQVQYTGYCCSVSDVVRLSFRGGDDDGESFLSLCLPLPCFLSLALQAACADIPSV